MRRRIKKIKPLKPTVFLKHKRKIGGVAPKRWCPDFMHRGPWLAEGGLVAPDNATPEGREVIESTASSERCEWCGHVRVLTELEMRRRLRPKDFYAARLVRKAEESTRRSFSFGAVKKLFLLEVSDTTRKHMVGRERTFCGEPVVKAAWDTWAGQGGAGRPSSRCPACHKEAVRLSDDQMDVLFAHMLALGRALKVQHPRDHVKAHDLETGRVLLTGEWCNCDHCKGTGRTRPDPAEYVWDPCDPCDSRGWLVS